MIDLAWLNGKFLQAAGFHSMFTSIGHGNGFANRVQFLEARSEEGFGE